MRVGPPNSWPCTRKVPYCRSASPLTPGCPCCACCHLHYPQDPSDKRFIKCDAKLKALFKEDRISGFSFMKYAAPHMLKD